jgi:hypothetical protein
MKPRFLKETHHMKTTLKISLLAILSAAQIHAETVTLYARGGYPEPGRSATITLLSNEIAQVNYASLGFDSAVLYVNDGTASYRLAVGSLPLPVISGPATIYLQTGNTSEGQTNTGVCTLSIARLGDRPVGNFVPSNAVVIPADSGGSAQIILESSIDLVSWTAATPGTYGAQTQKRFFRVRAQY